MRFQPLEQTEHGFLFMRLHTGEQRLNPLRNCVPLLADQSHAGEGMGGSFTTWPLTAN
jgi:hypothetical protein